MRQSVIEQLDAIPMPELFKHYHVEWEEGRNFRCPFPAHGASGNTPSGRFYPETNTYGCFGCHKGGGPIHFVMNMEGIDYVQACDKLMEMYGMEKLPEFSYQKLIDKAKSKEETRDEQIKFGALGDLLSQCDPADTDFLKKFSFLYAQIKDFSSDHFLTKSVDCLTMPVKDFIDNVPQAIKDNQMNCILLIKTFLRHGFEMERNFDPALLLSGYYSDAVSGFKWQNQNGRYVFPIFLPGKVVAGFSGRALMGEFVKYQTDILFNLSKKDLVFGLDHALPYIKSTRQCIVVEGILDAVRCWSLGFHNTVAPCCTYVSPNIMFLLKGITDRFILLNDNDYGGGEEAAMSEKIIKKHNKEYLRVLVPEGEDPDSYGKWHPTDMAELIKQSLN